MRPVRPRLALGILLAVVALPGCGSSDSTSANQPAGEAPASAFSFSPDTPSAGQSVQFTDSSTGSPSSWAWTFGDGSTSSARNPSHAYTADGSFPVTLTTANARGSSTSTRNVVVASAQSRLNIVLGRPTDTSIAAGVLTEPGTDVYVEYGAAPGRYQDTTQTSTVPARGPAVVEITGLKPDTRYFYRARFRSRTEVDYHVEPEHTFQTQRSAGSAFGFGVQGDSHPERAGNMFNAGLYALNMQNVAAKQPDFYIALGDDFSVEPLLTRDQLTQANVDQLFVNQRGYFGTLGHSSAVFLINGNHEQAAAYLLSDRYNTPYRNAAMYEGSARITHFALPAPGGFYKADTTQIPGVGLIRDYYAWEWGDALFVTIDPYWHSPVPVDNGVPGVDKVQDPWSATMGDEQYAWFKSVLESSRAKYKFVFEHHVLGTGRGAAAIVHNAEWGGYNKSGTAYEFSSMRRGWSKPIHQLMEENKVTIFFCGHDHLFAREKVDGVIYQEVPNPADNTYTAFNNDAYDPPRISLPGARYDPSNGVTMSNAGFLYVTVAPDRVTVSYVRAVLPGDESKAGGANGAVAFTYSVTPDRAVVTDDPTNLATVLQPTSDSLVAASSRGAVRPGFRK
jgi:PKD repeat protein